MDNKVTKKRINDHLEYDWFKYIIILLVSILVGYFIFSQINSNKDYETIDLFIACYGSTENEYEPKTLQAMGKDMDAKYGENVIREINLNVQDPLGKDFGSLFMTQGSQSSDILVLPVGYLENGGEGYVTLTDELLKDYLLPSGMNIEDLEYFEYENPTTKVKTRHGIRVDRYSGYNAVFETDWEKNAGYKDKDWGENPPSKEFYLVLNPRSVSIGKFGKKAEDKNAHALFCVNKLIEFYFKK